MMGELAMVALGNGISCPNGVGRDRTCLSSLLTALLYSVPLERQQGGRGGCGWCFLVSAQLLPCRFLHWLQPRYSCPSSCIPSLPLLGVALGLLLLLEVVLLLWPFSPLHCPSCPGSFRISPLPLFGQLSWPAIVLVALPALVLSLIQQLPPFFKDIFA